MIEKAQVVQTKDEMAKVQVKRASACGESCASCKGGCAPSNTYVDAINTIGAKPGDTVEIEMSTKTFLSAVAITYGLPLIMLFVGIFTGSMLVDSLRFDINKDLAGILLGFGLMGIAYIFIHKADKRHKEKDSIQFQIIKILQ